MSQFYIGTTNHHKAGEFGSILAACGCRLERTDPIDPEETESDFVGNATLKARAYARHAGDLAISEDSGLVVESLNGLPGPWSARFSDCIISDSLTVSEVRPSGRPREVIDPLNSQRVLELLGESPNRRAWFKTVLVVANPEGDILFCEEGQSDGQIALSARGNNGWGYDSIFIGNRTAGKTYAELDSHRKNLRSHRKMVLDKFSEWLLSRFRSK